MWTARQGMVGRLDVGAWRSSTKIEAPVDKLRNLRVKDATTKFTWASSSIYWLQKAGFSASIYSLASILTANLMARSVVWKAPCLLKLVMLLSNIWVWFRSKCICWSSNRVRGQVGRQGDGRYGREVGQGTDWVACEKSEDGLGWLDVLGVSSFAYNFDREVESPRSLRRGEILGTILECWDVIREQRYENTVYHPLITNKPW